MRINFTNGSKNQAASEKTEIDIKGNCKITSYDPRKENFFKEDDLTIIVGKNSSNIITGDTLQDDKETVNLNNMYSIFTAIAEMDGDGSTLTRKDIAKAKKNYNKQNSKWKSLASLGVTQIRYDSHAKVATIVIGDKEILRIDFETRREARKAKRATTRTASNADKRIAQSYKDLEIKTTNKFFTDLAEAESSGNPENMSEDIEKRKGYAGLYQIGEQALADIGVYPKQTSEYHNDWKCQFLPNKYNITSLEDFLNSPEKQKEALIAIMKRNWEYVKLNGLDRYIGEEKNGHLITESGMIAGAHLVGVGPLEKFLISDGKIDTIDDNETAISEYIDRFAAYDMFQITGEKPGTLPPQIIYENVHYTVVKGDNLHNIAQRFCTTVDRIKEANNIKNDTILINQRLIIPAGKNLNELKCK